MTRRTPLQKGFTLIEVLVSMAIMALLSTMAYAAVSTMTHARTVVQRSTNNTLAMQVAVEQWSHDWTSAAGLNMPPGAQYSGNAIRMVRAHPNAIGQVVAWKSTPSGLERVAWPSANSASTLDTQWNAAWDWIQQAPTENAPIPSGERAVFNRWPMLKEMEIFYYMDNAWTQPYNVDSSEGWPYAVRLQLKTSNGAITSDWKNTAIMATGSP